jgi:hypothetical protein
LKHFVSIDASIYRIRLRDDRPRDLPRGVENYVRLYPAADDTFFVTERSLAGLREAELEFDVVRAIPPKSLKVSIFFPLETGLYDTPQDDVKEEIVAFALSRDDRGMPSQPVYCGRTREDIEGTFVLDRPGGVRNYRWRWDKRKRKRTADTFARRFPKLIKRMKDPDTRFVVSLGGGGLLLFAHPSIFKLLERMGVRSCIEEIWGCSGGAIAGMAYALGADHQIIEQEGYDIYNRKYSFELSPSKVEVLKNVLYQALPGTALSFKGFVDIQKSMQESMARIVKRTKPSIPFFGLTYNMDEQRGEVLTPGRIRSSIYEGFIRHARPLDVVMASSAIPILFAPCVIRRGRTSQVYIDGSFGEEVPLSSVYHKWVLDRKHRATKKKKIFILSVNLFPYFSTQEYFGRALIKLLPVLEWGGVLLRLTDLIRRVRIDECMKSINVDPNAMAVEVRLPKLSKYNFLNPQIIPTVIERARGTFYRQLQEIEAKL